MTGQNTNPNLNFNPQVEELESSEGEVEAYPVGWPPQKALFAAFTPVNLNIEELVQISPPAYAIATIQGRPTAAIIDSGAGICIISQLFLINSLHYPYRYDCVWSNFIQHNP